MLLGCWDVGCLSLESGSLYPDSSLGWDSAQGWVTPRLILYALDTAENRAVKGQLGRSRRQQALWYRVASVVLPGKLGEIKECPVMSLRMVFHLLYSAWRSCLQHQLWSWIETMNAWLGVKQLVTRALCQPSEKPSDLLSCLFYSNCWTKPCNQIIRVWWVLNSISCSVITELEVIYLVNFWLDTICVIALPVNISN